MNPLIGTWTLRGSQRELLPSGQIIDTFKPGTLGFIHYMDSGRMSVVITEGGRKPLAGDVATESEAAALFRAAMAYAGTYTYQGDRVLHHIETATMITWSGQTQTRLVHLEGRRLRLSTLPSKDPFTGESSVRRLFWERLGD
jgi:hypothetical protein